MLRPMHALRIILLACLLALAGCINPRDETLSRLKGADIPRMRSDVAALHTQWFGTPGPQFVPVRIEQWPQSVQRLRPLRMTLYKDGLSIALHDEPGAEYGIHIVPPGDIPLPRSTPRVNFEPLGDGLLLYIQKR